MSGTYPISRTCLLSFLLTNELFCFHSAPEFTGFAIANKSSPKPPVTSALASKLASSNIKKESLDDNKHEMLRRVTEASQIGVRKEDLKEMDRALEEDPTAFDYDDIYEEMQPKLQTKRKAPVGNARYGYGITVSEKGTSKETSEPAPQSRYIQSLLSKARDRETEREMVLERQRHRENMKFEEKFGETESFVTPEYMAKMTEDQKKRDEMDAKEARERSSGTAMSNFYASLSGKSSDGDSGSRRQDPQSELPTRSEDRGRGNSNRRSEERPIDDEEERFEQKRIASPEEEEEEHSSSKTSEVHRKTVSRIVKPERRPRRHTEEMVEEAKKRFQIRQAMRSNETLQT